MKNRLLKISLLLGGLCLAGSLGCTRAYYRQQADNEVYKLLELGQRDPRWELERYTIDVNPASRFYDPTCPDHSPMPPDDPTAHQLMHCVDCKNGWPCWHRNGDTPFVENPTYQNYLPYDEQGNVVLNREGAIQLALIHSSGYQQNLESLYLSALDVTFERFRFDTQFFAGNDTFFSTQGSAAPGGSSSTLSTNTDFQAQRLFASGGELVIGAANSFVWQFAGPDTEQANTLLDFTFIQPLLRFAGRERVLERLTVAERVLLGNIRAMQRYRQGFYVQIVTGRGAPQGPQRRGGFLGGAGLQGFSGVGGGGFGRIGGDGGGGGGGGGATGGAGAAQVNGYLGLLQDQRQIENLRSNVAGLRRSLELLEALYDANRIDRLQVDLARQTLFNQQSALINAEAAFQTSLDNFKLTLGLPPDLPVQIEDPLFAQFELLGPDMVDLQNEAGTMLARLAAPANGEGAPPPVTFAGEEQLGRDLDLMREAIELLRLTQTLVPPGANPFQVLRERFSVYDSRLEQLQIFGAELRSAVQQLKTYPNAIQAAADLQQKAQAELPQVEAALQQLDSRIDDRVESLTDLAEREEVKIGKVDLRAFDIEGFRRRVRQLPLDYADVDRRLSAPLDRWETREQQLDRQRANIEDLMQRFSQILTPLRPTVDRLKEELAKPGQLDLPPEAQPFRAELDRLVDDPAREVERFAAELRRLQELLNAVFDEVNLLAQDASGLGLIQARARLEATRLLPIDLEPAKAFSIAQENRLDLMNARAQLVDSWRLIEFNADALQSDLSIEFSGDLNTTDDNPFRFRGTTGRLNAGLRFDAPITRVGERNTYRQALIEYQQARRSFITFNDQIKRGLRNILRTIELNQLNFELRRAAVQVAIEQVELASLRLQEPPRPGVVTQGLGATTARDLISALSDLLTAQNAYLSVFANYEQQRLELDLDLGTMQLDPRGLWLDPGSIDQSSFDGCHVAEEDADPAPAPPELLPGPDAEAPAAPEAGENETLPPPSVPAAPMAGKPKEKQADGEANQRIKLHVPQQEVEEGELREPLRLSPESIESAKAVEPFGLRLIARPDGWKKAKTVAADMNQNLDAKHISNRQVGDEKVYGPRR